MTAQLPRKVSAGEPISAEQWNRMVDLVALLSSVRGLHPVRVDRRGSGNSGGGGLVISLETPSSRRAAAVITQVNGGAGPGLASSFTYSVRLLDRREAGGAGADGLLTNMTPKFRPNRDSVEIWPGQVGDPCEVEYRNKADGTQEALLIFYANCEVTAWGSCA